MRSQLEQFFTRAWQERGWLAYLLLPLSWLFGAIAAMRRYAYARGWFDSTRLNIPVIVVGNIFIGGTGKTPFVIWLAQALRRSGFHPGIVSRGYGRQGELPLEVGLHARPDQVGDEPLLLVRHAGCPVIVGRDRVAAAQALLQSHPATDVIICDDGLQHYRLQRDLEIVMFDARGVGNGFLLPAGPLREPVARRRDFTVINSTQATQSTQATSRLADAWQMRLIGEEAYALARSAERMRLVDIVARQRTGGCRIIAAAGIGNPSRFFNLLRNAGLEFKELPLPDHYDFSVNPFAGQDDELILITEKDAVKCRHLTALNNDARLWVVPVVAELDAALLPQLLEKLRGLTSA